MTIRRRLVLSFLSILALFAVNILVYFWSSQYRAAAAEANRHALTRQILIASIDRKITDVKREISLLNEVSNQGSPPTTATDAYKSGVAQFDSQINDVRAEAIKFRKLSSDDAKASAEKLERILSDLSLSWKNFSRSFGQNQTQAILEIATHIEPLSEQAKDLLKQLERDERLRAERSGQAFIRATLVTDRVSLLLFMFSTLVAIAVAITLSRHLTRGLAALERGALAIGSGKLEHQIEIRGRDELATLGSAFNQMSENLASARTDLLGAQEEMEQRNRELERRDRELEAINSQLAESENSAQSANQAKSEFLANMSHELRTPLNAIIGYSEMLMEEAEDAGLTDLVPDIKRIHAAGKHLYALINDVLDLSKIEAGKMDLFLEDFDVQTMVGEVETTVQPLVHKNSNTLQVRCAEDVGRMHADLTKVRQVLFNLLSNATKFSDHGVIKLAVERSIIDSRGTVQFRIEDTGIGMSQEQMAKLFSAFTQADASTTRKYGGTGLGLVISRRFCQMMGGDIIVESVPGQGSTFTATIPADVASKPVEIPQVIEPELASGDQAGPSVLIIDDDASARNLIARHLIRGGYSVHSAASGEEGLKLARELKPSVITLDVMMPTMDGWSVLSMLKGDAALRDIPVILLTMVDDKELGFTLGASDYLCKPIDREQLISVLSKYRTSRHTEPVLVVDDDEPTRKLIARALESAGWSVIQAENGRDALDRIQETRPALILLDLIMPIMDGFAFVAELNRNDEWKSIPVVVTTSKTITPEDQERLNGCVQAVLTKDSFSRDGLLNEVRKFISDPDEPAHV